MMSLWDALRMNMMISYQELVRTFPNGSLYTTAARITKVIKYMTFELVSPIQPFLRANIIVKK
ncbi:hypothetical protein, partial [Klebsiella pneumoniae]|uniref:hypothetical protein n=1 Tax=Klebsiella pneumoniae TaxID=573 RepID=UPI002243BA47